MKNIILSISLIFLLLFTTTSIGVPSPLDDVATCSNLTDNNTVYTLTSDLTGFQDWGGCIGVNANNVTIDCDYHNITGNYTDDTYGIYVFNDTNVTLKNCNITRYKTGIYLINTNNSNISNNNVFRNNITGIGFQSSFNNTIENNIVSYVNISPETEGCHIDFMYGFICYQPDSYGILFSESSNNTVINNNISCAKHGICFDYSSSGSVYNILEGNIVYDSDNGLFIGSEYNYSTDSNSRYYNNIYDVNVSAPSNSIFTNIFLGDGDNRVNLSWEGQYYAIRSRGLASEPSGYDNVSVAVSISKSDSDIFIANAWIFVNISYNETDFNNSNILNESSLRIWRIDNIQSRYRMVGPGDGVNTDSNYVYVNITEDENEFRSLLGSDVATTYEPLGPVNQMEYYIINCSNLTQNNALYFLISNLTGNQSWGGCIGVNADNVTIDCNTYSYPTNEYFIPTDKYFITGSGSGSGILIDSRYNVTVVHSNIINYTEGILITGNTNNSNISENTLHGNVYGIAVSGTGSPTQNRFEINNIFNNSVNIYDLSGVDSYYLNNILYDASLWDFSKYNSSANVFNMILGNGFYAYRTNLDFTGFGFNLSSAENNPTPPENYSSIIDYTDVSEFLDIVNNTGNGWVFLNMTFNEPRFYETNITNKSSLRIWRNSSGNWTEIGDGVNTNSNYVYANISAEDNEFGSIFGILGPVASDIPKYCELVCGDSGCVSGNTTPGIYICLSSTISSSVSSAITIGANNQVLDCVDRRIVGGTQYGVKINNKNNVTVKNCNMVSCSGKCIYFGVAENGSIDDNNFDGCMDSIYVTNSNGINVTNNIIENSRRYGIYYSGNGTIDNNTINNAGTSYTLYHAVFNDIIHVTNLTIDNILSSFFGGISLRYETTGTNPPSGYSGISHFVDMESNDVNSSSWVDIKINYDDEDHLNRVDSENNLDLFYYNSTGWFVADNSSVDTTNNYVHANMSYSELGTEFSVFGHQIISQSSVNSSVSSSAIEIEEEIHNNVIAERNFTILIKEIEPEKPAKIVVGNVHNIIVKEITINVKSRTNGSLTITDKEVSQLDINTLPPTFSVTGKVNNTTDSIIYKYFEIDTTIPEDYIENVEILIRIDKDWFEENNMDPNMTSIYRYNEGEWKNLETYLVSEDNDYYYYNAISPGFSMFVMTSKIVAESSVASVDESDDEYDIFNYSHLIIILIFAGILFLLNDMLSKK